MKRLWVGALCALVGSAHADRLIEPAVDWKGAQQLFADAQQTGDIEKYKACAKAFVAISNQVTPKSKDATAALFSAAICHERGHEAKAALAIYEQLGKLPPSEYVAQGMFREAQLAAYRGEVVGAAMRFEAYAAKFAKQPQTVTKDLTAELALYNAAQMWLVRGDDAKAIAAGERYLKTYAASPDAPKLARSIAPVYERRGAAAHATYLQGVVRRFKDKLGPQELDIRLALGEALWKRSCGVPAQTGLCVKIDRAAAAPTGPQTHCRGANRLRYTVVKRDARFVREAKAELERVVKLGESRGPDGARQVARAKLLLADEKLETYLAQSFPSALDFNPNKPEVSKASLKKFQGWIDSKTKLGGELRDRYTAIPSKAAPMPETDVAAMARIGQMLESMAIDLATAEIPRDVRTGEFAAEKIDAFCDKMIEVAEPLEKQAEGAYTGCLTKASQSSTHDESSQLCERGLAHLDPANATVTTELVPLPPPPIPLALEGAPPGNASHPPDLTAALAAYKTAAAHGTWTAASCKDTAAKFAAIEKKHSSIDARYMEGLAYMQCGMHVEADRAFRFVWNSDRASPWARSAAMVNAGVVAFRTGNTAEAIKAWSPVKLPSAYANLAAIQIERLRAQPIDKIASDKIRANLDAGFSLDPSDDAVQLVRASAMLAGWNTGTPAAIEDSLRQAGPAGVDAQLAWAALEARRGAWPLVDRATQTALAAAPNLDDVQAARGLLLVRVRRWAEAADHLAKVKAPSYAVLVGRGIALRGQGKLADAEAAYGKAIAMADARAEAHYNLGVLQMDHVAARSKDVAATRAALQKASTAFRKAAGLKPASDAKQRADECDKRLAALSP